jgi:glutamate synthase domain-containing protein 2
MAKALALGADAISVGTGALLPLIVTQIFRKQTLRKSWE